MLTCPLILHELPWLHLLEYTTGIPPYYDMPKSHIVFTIM